MERVCLRRVIRYEIGDVDVWMMHGRVRAGRGRRRRRWRRRDDLVVFVLILFLSWMVEGRGGSPGGVTFLRFLYIGWWDGGELPIAGAIC